jgi:hypothetical protein
MLMYGVTNPDMLPPQINFKMPGPLFHVPCTQSALHT